MTHYLPAFEQIIGVLVINHLESSTDKALGLFFLSENWMLLYFKEKNTPVVFHLKIRHFSWQDAADWRTEQQKLRLFKTAQIYSHCFGLLRTVLLCSSTIRSQIFFQAMPGCLLNSFK